MFASDNNSNQLFSIEDIKQKTDIVEVVSRYINLNKQGKDYMGLCPFHDEKTPSFSVSPEKQLFHCFGCSESGNVFQFLMKFNGMTFQDAVSHLSGNAVAIPHLHRKQNKSQNKTKNTPIPNTEIELAILSGAINSPEKVSHPHPAKPGKETWVTRYFYSDTQWVDRIEWTDANKSKGYDKIALPYHLDESGTPVNAKGEKPWHPYRWNEVLAHGKGKWILGLEGEPCVEGLRQIGLVGFTWQGGSWSPEIIKESLLEAKSAGVAGIIYFPDNDEAGRKKADKVLEAANSIGLPCIVLNPLEVWSEMPDKGDIVDCLNSGIQPSVLENKIIDIAQKSADKQKLQEFSGGSGGNGNGGDDGGNKVINFPGSGVVDEKWLITEVDKLISKNLPNSLVTAELNKLAAVCQINVVELRKIYRERLSESELENERSDNKAEVDNLLKIENKSLDLNDYLPTDLAEPLTQWCQWLAIQPQTVLTALLVGVSSLHKVGTELVIHRGQEFRVPSNIFAGLVSESGQKKSPILTNIIRKPLKALRNEKIDAYNAAMQDYKAALAAWQKSGGEGEEPPEPQKPPRFWFTNATGESIPVHAQKYPKKTLFALIDELAGYFNSANSYRSGRGSDKQDLLSYFDGTGQSVLRASDEGADVPDIYLSVFGTIQPEILRRYMEYCSDPDGSWSRFLFVHQPLQAATLADDDGYSVQIHERIADYYRRVDQLPEMEYRLSHQAFKRYQPLYNKLEKLRITQPNSGMRAVYSKMEGYIGRLALNLHVLWELAVGKECPDEEIPLFIMKMAIALAKFYIGQVKLIHMNCDEESLPSHINRLISYSKRLGDNGDKSKGWVKASTFVKTFYASDKKKRPSSEKARQMFLEAVAMGYGCTRGTGNKLEYHWNCDNKNTSVQPDVVMGGDGWGRNGDDHHHAQTIKNTSVQANMVMDGDGFPFFSDPLKLQNVTLSVTPNIAPGTSSDTSIEEKNSESITNITTNGCDPNICNTSSMVMTITTSSPSTSNHHHEESPPIAAEPSGTVSAAPDAIATEAPSVDPWTEEAIIDLAGILDAHASSKEALAALRETEGFTPDALNKACKLLTPEKHQQIKSWVIELNSEKQTASLIVGTRIKHRSEYTGAVSGKNSQGDYFIHWDKVCQKLAAQHGFQLPTALKIDQFEVMS